MKEIEVYEENTEVGLLIAAAVVCTTGCVVGCASSAGVGSALAVALAAEAGGVMPI